MARTVYLNGDYLPETEAKISIFDRGVLFGDGIYEVGGVIDGKIISFESHMARYHRSLAELQIPQPLSESEVLAAFRKLIELNDIKEGLVYMEITRGTADRDFIWQNDLKPTVFMFTQQKPDDENLKVKTGVKLKSTGDIRWARRDIKSVNLLGQVLAKNIAHAAGAYEALMIDSDGFITECGSTSFFMVKGHEILTRPLNNNILAGITRKSIFALCEEHDINLVERKFTLQEALGADEAMISGASSYILPVTEIDGQTIGTGKPGQWFQRLYDIYVDFARAGAI